MKRPFFISLLSLTIGILAVNLFKEASAIRFSASANLTQSRVKAAAKSDSQKRKSNEKLQSEDVLALASTRLYDFSKTTEETQDVLQKMARRLTESQIQYLEEVSLDELADQDERVAAMYILTLSGTQGHNSLLKVVITPSSMLQGAARPHSVGEMKQNFEFSLRLMAMEALERNSLLGEALIPIDSKILNQIKDGKLRRLFGLVLEGQRNQQPLLKKFIDQQIAKVEI